MAKNLADALAALALVQGAVTVTVGGVTFATRRVYTYPPNANDALPTTPAWINQVEMPRAPTTGAQLRRMFYTVRTQCFIADQDITRGIEVATRMHMDYIDRLSSNVTLKDAGGAPTVTRVEFRSPSPMLGTAERAGQRYEVLDMFVDMLIEGPYTFA